MCHPFSLKIQRRRGGGERREEDFVTHSGGQDIPTPGTMGLCASHSFLTHVCGRMCGSGLCASPFHPCLRITIAPSPVLSRSVISPVSSMATILCSTSDARDLSFTCQLSLHLAYHYDAWTLFSYGTTSVCALCATYRATACLPFSCVVSVSLIADRLAGLGGEQAFTGGRAEICRFLGGLGRPSWEDPSDWDSTTTDSCLGLLVSSVALCVLFLTHSGLLDWTDAFGY